MTKDWPVKSHTPLLLLAMLANDHSAGVEFYKQRQFSKTIEALERAVATEKLGTPEYRESAVILGQSYYLSARLPEAAAWLQKAVDDGARINEVFYMLGNCYIQQREPVKSRAAFAAMFGVPFESAAAHLLTAQFLVRQEFEEFALKELARWNWTRRSRRRTTSLACSPSFATNSTRAWKRCGRRSRLTPTSRWRTTSSVTPTRGARIGTAPSRRCNVSADIK